MEGKGIALLQGANDVGTFGWRHQLAWRQLSLLWQIPISQLFSGDGTSIRDGVIACSAAIASREPSDIPALQKCYDNSVVVTFLNSLSVKFDRRTEGATVQFQEPYTPRNSYRHVFQIRREHALTAGLPDKVVVYGDGPAVTPLQLEDGMEVLVSLEGVPIIAYVRPHLFVGADPWQLGVPSVPMVYQILSNWLTNLGCSLDKMHPYAMIRLDDLPITAYELAGRSVTPRLDRRRARIIRRLRSFAARSGVKMSLMYSSHYYDSGRNPLPIGAAMPQSIHQIALGVRQGVFEIGSHGMVHLSRSASDPGKLDHREFQDLDEPETEAHLKACKAEIEKCFGTTPRAFVAPTWAYRPGVTKKVAARRYPLILDASQRVERGTCDPFLTAGNEGPYINLVETFRPGSRMLAFGNSDFWRCYAAAGIPVHYMQHTDRNWHIIWDFLKRDSVAKTQGYIGRVKSKLLRCAEDYSRPFYWRVLCTGVLSVLAFCSHPSSLGYLWKTLTRSSIYAFAQAMQTAGYRCTTLSEFVNIIMKTRNSPSASPYDVLRTSRFVEGR